MAHRRARGGSKKLDPLEGPTIYTIGVFESRIGGSIFWILPGSGRVRSRFVVVELILTVAPSIYQQYLLWGLTYFGLFGSPGYELTRLDLYKADIQPGSPLIRTLYNL